MGLELIIERSTHLLSYTNIFTDQYHAEWCYSLQCVLFNLYLFFDCFQMILSQGFDFQDLILVFNFYMFLFLFIFFLAIVSGRDYALKHVVKLLKQYQKSMGEVIFFFGYEKENYHMIFKKIESKI